MYVNNNGVIQEDLKRAQSLEHWPQSKGHDSITPSNVSRPASLASKLNSTLLLMLVFAVVTSTGLAFAVRSNADAHAPASIYSFGKATEFGNPEISSDDEVVAISSSKVTSGYWTVTKRGKVQAFGEVVDYGEIPEDRQLTIVDISSTPSGNGYWLLENNGNVFTFGDATFHKAPSMEGITGRNFVKILPTQTGNGYAMVEDSGDVLAYGDATVYGTAKGQLNGDKIIDARNTPDDNGYIMLSAKGAVFAFGNATFFGAVSAGQLTDVATAIAFSENAKGYWILTQNGIILPFGEAQSFGNAAESSRTGAPSIDMAIHNSGDGYWVANGKIAPAPPVKIVQKVVAQVAPIAAQASVNASNPDIWQALRNCEAGGVYTRNSGNGYYGAYQFSAGTWNGMNTGYARADLAPPEVQDDAARRLQARSGWGQWPACSRKIGVR